MTLQIIILNTIPVQSDGSFGFTGVFWLVPSNNYVALPSFISQVPFIDPADLLLLQTGQLVEQSFNSGLFPSGTTLATIEASLQTQYSAAQTVLTGNASPLSGIIGNTYNGTIWSTTNPFTPSSVNITTGTLGASGASVQISISNLQSVGVQIAAGTFIGTIIAETSFDDGTTWNQTYFSGVGNGNKLGSYTYLSANTAVALTIVMNGGVGLARIFVASYTSGSCTATLRASDISDSTLELFAASPGSANPPSIAAVGAFVTASSPSYTTGLANALSLNTSGGLRVDGSAVTQPVSGTVATTQSTSPWSDNITQIGGVSVAAVAKGTQASNAMGVQDFKDSGRVAFVAVASAVTGVTTEALISLTPVRTVTAGTAGTSLTVTSGKTMRLQALALSIRNTASTQTSCTVRLRMNSTTVTATSQVFISLVCNTLTATSGMGNSVNIDLPDGFEISGTTQFGISQLCSSTSCTIDVELLGFEY